LKRNLEPPPSASSSEAVQRIAIQSALSYNKAVRLQPMSIANNRTTDEIRSNIGTQHLERKRQ
jgi:hypothetical protein